MPMLTEEGRKAIEEELKEPADHKLEEESSSESSTPGEASGA